MQSNDYDELKSIHERYYKTEFEFPDFISNYLCSFTVVDGENRIISAGGVRLISETVILTDQAKSARERRQALIEILVASKYVASQNGFRTLNAFVSDEKWKRHLMKIGFKPQEILQLEFANG